MRGSGMQWSFSNKVSALPQFMPYKAVQEERSKKIVFDPLTSSAFMPISTVDAFDTNHKTFTGLVQQKNFNIDRQGDTHYTTTAYPVQDVCEQSFLQDPCCNKQTQLYSYEATSTWRNSSYNSCSLYTKFWAHGRGCRSEKCFQAHRSISSIDHFLRGFSECL